MLVITGKKRTPGIDGGIMTREFPLAVINTIKDESLEEILKKIEASGGKRVHDPNEIPSVGTHVYCADPDGILFGVLQSPPPKE